ncbi:hypothetical protein LS48_01950 [Aequorivita aquimaris]|uniref:histidine kinase n=1 Tax=Aequorivita aquimaris TaxID=1548749 RepID=A0A137RM26_9FLAO|nr:hypothetical protein LS48_01950 [Aequorivita aquimaris]
MPNFFQPDRTQQLFEKYYQKAQIDSLSLNTRIRLLHIAYEALKYTPTDSLKYSSISKVVVASSHLEDSIFFHKFAMEGLKLAKHLKNPSFIADAHWNYGAYYLNEKKYDSSYFHYDRAYKLFQQVNKNYYAGKMLYNMAYISSQTNDFTGAEILLFRSIKYFEGTTNFKQLYLCYNLLGTNADDMEEYDKALVYYTAAEKFIPKINNSEYYQLELLNNMGVRLHKIGKYENAIIYFDKALGFKETLSEAPSLYAKLLDNKAFSYLALGKYGDVRPFMEKALTLRDSIDDRAGSTIGRLRFAIYFAKIGDTISAIKYAEDAMHLAEQNYFSRDLLDALELLAELDQENRVDYFKKHIALGKTLSARDRNLRNKFTAIQYETDKYIRENKWLFKQKLWITIGAIIVTLLLLFIYLNTRQRARNKALLFEREQQQYNEDLFLMAMEQKTTLERGRSQERLRISEELHDGILARLFAIRFKWSFIQLDGDEESLMQHKKSISLLTDIESEIRNVSHDLRNDLIWEELGFRNEIENCIKERSEIGQFKTSLNYGDSDRWESLDYLYKINICRILDEILHNIIKHAEATYVSITFLVEDPHYIITVADNGKGFNKSWVRKGIGLKNLKIRANKMKGHLTVSSKVGIGTTVEIKF